MGVHSGKFGAIDVGAAVQPSIQNWNLNDNMTPSEYVVSGSQGGRVRVEGVRNWDGSYNQITGEPTILPGLGGAFKGYTAPDDDVLGSAGVTYSGDILVSEAQINWDWEAGDAVNSSCTFMGDGELTVGSDTVVDTSVPDIDTICPTKIETSTDGLAWTPVPNLTSAQLTLTCELVDYVNSSTNCTTGRKPGPIDWTLALDQQDNIRTGHIDIGDVLYLRCWIDDTVYWYLAYGLVRDFTNLTVDVETGEVISRTINIDMNASNGTTLGGVISPSGVKWFNSSHTPPT